MNVFSEKKYVGKCDKRFSCNELHVRPKIVIYHTDECDIPDRKTCALVRVT